MAKTYLLKTRKIFREKTATWRLTANAEENEDRCHSDRSPRDEYPRHNTFALL